MDILIAGADLARARNWGILAGAAGMTAVCVGSPLWKKAALKAVGWVRKRLFSHGD